MHCLGLQNTFPQTKKTNPIQIFHNFTIQLLSNSLDVPRQMFKLEN